MCRRGGRRCRVSGECNRHVTCPFQSVVRRRVERVDAVVLMVVLLRGPRGPRGAANVGWLRRGVKRDTPRRHRACRCDDRRCVCGPGGGGSGGLLALDGIAVSFAHRHTTTAPRRSGPSRNCAAAPATTAHEALLPVVRRLPLWGELLQTRARSKRGGRRCGVGLHLAPRVSRPVRSGTGSVAAAADAVNRLYPACAHIRYSWSGCVGDQRCVAAWDGSRPAVERGSAEWRGSHPFSPRGCEADGLRSLHWARLRPCGPRSAVGLPGQDRRQREADGVWGCGALRRPTCRDVLVSEGDEPAAWLV